jgi:hypothetical protein
MSIKHQYAAGEKLDSLLEYMRSNGLEIVDCVKILIRLGIPLATIKEAIHTGEAWKDKVNQYDTFHESVEETLKDT